MLLLILAECKSRRDMSFILNLSVSCHQHCPFSPSQTFNPPYFKKSHFHEVTTLKQVSLDLWAAGHWQIAGCLATNIRVWGYHHNSIGIAYIYKP